MFDMPKMKCNLLYYLDSLFSPTSIKIFKEGKNEKGILNIYTKVKSNPNKGILLYFDHQRIKQNVLEFIMVTNLLSHVKLHL